MVRRPLCIMCLFVILICFIYVRGSGPGNVELPFLSGDTVVITGTVVDKAIKNDKQVIYLKDISFCESSSLISISSNYQSSSYTDSHSIINKNHIGLVCYLDGEMPPLGSFVMLSGRADYFTYATNPGEFDMNEYYYIQGYHFVIYDGKIQAISKSYNHYTEALYNFRQSIGKVYDSIFEEKDAQVIKAMVLGDKGNLDKEIKQLYQESGLAHILAISGLHVSLIGMCVYSFFKKMRIPGFIGVSVSIIVMINYGIMTGLGGSMLRALIMFTLMLASKLIKRIYDLETALSIAAATIVIINPYMLLYSGFWLSFMAVIGIAIFGRAILIVDEIENKRIKNIINTVLASVSVSFFTLPVILGCYYEYPVFSILINLILVPLMSILLIAGIVAGLTGLVNLNIAVFPAYICHYILKLYETVCGGFNKMSCSHIVFGKPGIIKIIIFYSVSIGLYWLVMYKRRMEYTRKQRLNYYRRMEKKCIGRYGTNSKKLDSIRDKIDEYSVAVRQVKFYEKLIVMGLLCVMLLPFRFGAKIIMLDVGQGDGICIMNKGETYFVDGGSSSNSHLTDYVIGPFLKSQGVDAIDYWFISHADKDHISGLVDLLGAQDNKGFTIRNICIPDSMSIDADGKELIELARENNINIYRLKRGDVFSSQGMKIDCINPEHLYSCDDANEYSMVLYLTYGSTDMLLTGDATTKSESQFIEYCRNNNIDLSQIDILKCGHHGSSTSTGDELIEAINPEVSLISSGRNNSYGHPHIEVLNRLNENAIAVYNTQTSGAITIVLKKDGYNITQYLSH